MQAPCPIKMMLFNDYIKQLVFADKKKKNRVLTDFLMGE